MGGSSCRLRGYSIPILSVNHPSWQGTGTRHTLAKKFDAVHRNTTHINNMIPIVCRAMPHLRGVGVCCSTTYCRASVESILYDDRLFPSSLMFEESCSLLMITVPDGSPTNSLIRSFPWKISMDLKQRSTESSERRQDNRVRLRRRHETSKRENLILLSRSSEEMAVGVQAPKAMMGISAKCLRCVPPLSFGDILR